MIGWFILFYFVMVGIILFIGIVMSDEMQTESRTRKVIWIISWATFWPLIIGYLWIGIMFAKDAEKFMKNPIMGIRGRVDPNAPDYIKRWNRKL